MRRLLCVLLVLTAGWAGEARPCVVRECARIPLTLVDGSILVALAVNARQATVILDTGAQRSSVTRDAVKRLDLALDEWVGTTVRGVGGVERHRNALPRSLSLGGLALERATRTRDTSLTVATLPGAGAAVGTNKPAIDGLLGRDFLSAFDLDLDLSGRVVVLYSVTGCSRLFLPWSVPYVALDVENPADTALVVRLTLDGVRLRAVLDTGAAVTVLTAPGIARMGLTPGALAGDPATTMTGIGPGAVVAHRHRFQALTVGAETIERPVLSVAPIRIVPIADMLLGADWLLGRRVWISFAMRQVFVAHRG